MNSSESIGPGSTGARLDVRSTGLALHYSILTGLLLLLFDNNTANNTDATNITSNTNTTNTTTTTTTTTKKNNKNNSNNSY